MKKEEYRKIIFWLLGTAMTILIATVSGTYILWREIYTNRLNSRICEETIKIHREVEHKIIKQQLEDLNRICIKKIIIPEIKPGG